MGIIGAIRKILGKEQLVSREQAKRLRGLPEDEARREAAALLYEVCVKLAAEFVKQELGRGDTPFRGLPPSILFHELLAVTFWLVDKRLAGGKRGLLQGLHDNYFSHFSASVSSEDRHRELMAKYDGYEGTWNEVTGHQDEFGALVTRNLFGGEEDPQILQRSFWIINYAHDAMKAIRPLKKILRDIGSK